MNVLERVTDKASTISFAKVDGALTSEPAFFAAGRDGSITLTVRGDHLPQRYRIAVGAFRFAQYMRLGLIDQQLAHRTGVYSEQLPHEPRREFHTLVIDRQTGNLAGCVVLTQPDHFGLEADYEGLQVDVDLLPGADRNNLWEAKRLVRRADMPIGQLGRNAPWWALLALTHTVAGLHKSNQLTAMIGDGDPDGSPAMLGLLDYDVQTISATPRATNANGVYGPMWNRQVRAVPFHATPHPRQEPLLADLTEFLTMARIGSVSAFLRAKGNSIA